MSSFQPCLLRLLKSVLRAWIRSEKNHIIWNAVYSSSACLSTITSPRLWKQKTWFKQKLRSFRVISELGRGAWVSWMTWQRNLFFWHYSSWEVGRMRYKEESSSPTTSNPCIPTQLLFSFKINFLFHLLTSLNNLAALRDIVKDALFSRTPWYEALTRTHHHAGILPSNA